MKKRFLKIGAIAMAVSLVLISLLPLSALAAQPTNYSKTSNSGTRHEVCTSLDGTSASSYYTGSYTYEKLSTLSSGALKSSLNALMSDTHAKDSTYNECRDMANLTDCENNDTSNITTLYSSYSTSHSEYANGQGWNREHVWPKSLGGFGTTLAGADLHHIRPAEALTNTHRSNLKYGNVSGGTTVTGNLSGLTGGTKSSPYFEPLDNVKGDVARIILYVHVRYYDEYSDCSSVTVVFESIDVLLEWCALDPVDTWEMGRNEVVQAYQGNRNVFIDYPELAWQLFGKEAPANMTTPSGGSSSSGDNGGSGSEGEDPVTPPTVTYPAIATIHASATGNYTTEGVVVAKNAKSYLLRDDTGVILVYLNATPTVSIGDWLRVSGTTTTYAGATQFGQSTTHQKLGTVSVSYPTPKILDGADCNAYLTDLSLDYVKVTGTLTASGSYYNLAIDGATLLGSITYPADTASLASYLNQKVEVTGYVTGITGSSTKYLNLMMTEIAPVVSCAHASTEIRNASAATCKTEGYTGDTYCKSCDELIASGTSIPKTEDHVWNDGEITRDATCTAEGEMVYICTVCGATKAVSLPTKSHYADIVTVEARPAISDTWFPEHTFTGVTDGSAQYCVFDTYYDCAILLEYGVSSEEDYDFLRIWQNGVLLDEISGEIHGKVRTLNLKAGDVLKIGYVKDISGGEGQDQGYFKFPDGIYIDVTTTERVPVESLNATCTEGVTCAVCQSLVKEATGHAWNDGEITLAPTYTTAGVKITTCTTCKKTQTETLSPLAPDWLVMASVTLADDLSYNVYALLPEGATDVRMIFTFDGKTVEVCGVSTADGRIKYVFDGILPQQMGKTVTATLTLTIDGVSLSETHSGSVESYAKTLLADETHAGWHALLKAMLNYGAAAQTVAKDTAHLVNEGLTGEIPTVDRATLSAVYQNGDSTIWTSAALVLDSNITLRIGVNAPENVDLVLYTLGGKTIVTPIVNGYVYIPVKAAEMTSEIVLKGYDGASATEDAALQVSATYYLTVAEPENADVSALLDAVAAYAVQAAEKAAEAR